LAQVQTQLLRHQVIQLLLGTMLKLQEIIKLFWELLRKQS
jgi:hypothetical protein